MTVDRLVSRWPLPGAAAVRDQLLAAYAAPKRGYHDLRHLEEVLDRLEELRRAGEGFDPTTVTLAAWFHDAVYDGRAGDEARSADWARTALPAAGLSAASAGEVARLVELTERHDAAPDDPDGAALCDADLAILASEPVRYTEYAEGVRREYAELPDDVFAAGRAAVLRRLLDRPALFATSHGRRRWEPLARRNVSEEISRLAPPPPGGVPSADGARRA